MDSLGPAAAATLRYEPPLAAARNLVRGRLVEVLRGRFERRLTVLAAGAGFGKTTLLAQAVHENRIERAGDDIWLRLDDRDREPARLLAGLAEALGRDGRHPDLSTVVDAVWQRAPISVALILDDTHVLDGVPASWEIIADLVVELPRNGHVVLSGRTVPSLRLDDQVGLAATLSENELAFTGDELGSLGGLRGLTPEMADELPSWPALAALTGEVGHSATIEYLWDEVLGAMSPSRRQLLAAASLFGEVDDELVTVLEVALTEVRERAGDRGVDPARVDPARVDPARVDTTRVDGGAGAALVAELPLIERTDAGTVRLHDLWVEALRSEIDQPSRAAALRAGGELFLSRGQHVRAAESFALADDRAGFRRVTMAYARLPNLQADQRDVERLNTVLPVALRSLPIARYLEAARYEVSDEHRASLLYRRAAEEARQAGEFDLETVATWRVIQYLDLDTHTGPVVAERLSELGEAGVPTARAVTAFVESRRAQLDGDPLRSRLLLDELGDFDPAQRSTSMAIRLIDLGLPEEIPATLDDVLASGVESIFDAQAVWLQGHASPELAWSVASPLADRGPMMPVTTRVSLNSVLITIAVAAGAHDDVLPLLEETRRLAIGAPRMVVHLAEAAAVLLDLVTDGEDTALVRLGRMLDQVPLGAWPERPYLYLLAVIRGLVPGGEMLDGCAFGPSFTVAVRAGAALAALRDGDPSPAAALPWDRLDLLRVHVPPPLLLELALAVGTVPEPLSLVSTRMRRPWLRRVADRHGTDRPPGRTAHALLRELPRQPPYRLHVRALGGLDLLRSDGVAMDGWDRRARVRQLLGHLLVVRAVDRAELATALWPDLDTATATANLRVNLHHLNHALHPERDRDEPPWFVQVEGSRLQLAVEGLVADIDQFVQAVEAAEHAEREGHTARALDLHEQADELYVGDLLPDLDDEVIGTERRRLRALAHSTVVRRGELVLTRGEPEAAMRLAVRSRRLDPLSEHTYRLMIRCQLALGSTGGARQVASRLRDDLVAAGLTPERETARLFDQLRV